MSEVAVCESPAMSTGPRVVRMKIKDAIRIIEEREKQAYQSTLLPKRVKVVHSPEHLRAREEAKRKKNRERRRKWRLEHAEEHRANSRAYRAAKKAAREAAKK